MTLIDLIRGTKVRNIAKNIISDKKDSFSDGLNISKVKTDTGLFKSYKDAGGFMDYKIDTTRPINPLDTSSYTPTPTARSGKTPISSTDIGQVDIGNQGFTELGIGAPATGSGLGSIPTADVSTTLQGNFDLSNIDTLSQSDLAKRRGLISAISTGVNKFKSKKSSNAILNSIPAAKGSKPLGIGANV